MSERANLIRKIDVREQNKAAIPVQEKRPTLTAGSPLLELPQKIGNRGLQDLLRAKLQTGRSMGSNERTADEPAGSGLNDKSGKITELFEILGILEQLKTEELTPPGTEEEQKRWQGTKTARRFPGLAKYPDLGETPFTNKALRISLIGMSRGIINSLTGDELQIDEKELSKLKAELHIYLNGLTPFYTQLENENILPAHGWEASERTCNLTSLAMVLEALGVTQGDFSGDENVILEIGKAFYPSKVKTGADLAELRLPDFLQLTAIYTRLYPSWDPAFQTRSIFYSPQMLPSLQSGGEMGIARQTTADDISTTLEIFKTVARLFGVERKNPGGISSYGTEKTEIDKKIKYQEMRMDLYGPLLQERLTVELEAMVEARREVGVLNGIPEMFQAAVDKKLQEKKANKKFQHTGDREYIKLQGEKQKLEQSTANLPGRYPDEKYRAAVEHELGPWLAKGAQVIVNRPGHYVRLAGYNENGILFYDPYTPGKNFTRTWAEANREGFFRSYQVFLKNR